MNFSSQLDDLIKPFIKPFGNCAKTKLSKESNQILKTIIISLYQDIYTSHEHILNSACFKHSLLHIQKELNKVKRPSDYKNNKFFPSVIQTYIKENELYQVVFSCGNVGNREINIHFTLFTKEDLNKLESYYVQHVRMMYIWLNICAKYANTSCTNILDIYIYPTPFTKNLPGSSATVLGPEHVNTAYTMPCAARGQLVIFREEEWFKVFIHETFHAYGLDFSRSDIKELKNHLKSLFPINSDFDLYEAYTETWARLINCLFCSFNALTDKKDKKAFIANVDFCIELERMFALYQCTKVLSFMGLHYNDIHEENNYLRHNLYKENTHVFAYYIMTAVLLNDYQGFMLWCKSHNTNLLKFESTPLKLKAFADYITRIYKCISLLDNIDHIGKLVQQVNKAKKKNAPLIKTTRMSIIHTI